MPQASRRSLLVPLLVLALVSTLAKAWVVLAPRPDLLTQGAPGAPTGPDNPGGWVTEEVHRGNVAAEVLDGPLLPLLDYAYTPFFGGSVAIGVVASPLFLVFGRNFLALKLAAVLFQALAVASAVALLDRHVSRRAAWLGGLLLALAPAGHTAISILAWGSHCEAIGLSLAATLLALRAVEAGRARPAWHAAAGAAAGLCVWFEYSTLPALAGLAACALWGWRTVLPRVAWIPLALGLAAGLAPWLVYNLRHGFEGLHVYETPLGGELLQRSSWGAAPGRLWSLASEGLPFFATLDASAGAAARLALALAAFAAVGAGAWAWTRNAAAGSAVDAQPASGLPVALAPLRVAWAGIAFYLAAYATQGFQVETARPLTLRYLTPLWGLAALALPATLEALTGLRPRARRAWAAAFAVWILAGGAAWRTCWDARRVGFFAEKPATDARGLGRWVAGRFGAESAIVLGAIEAARAERDAAFQREFEGGVVGMLRFLTEDPAQLGPRRAPRAGEYAATLAAAQALIARLGPPADPPEPR